MKKLFFLATVLFFTITIHAQVSFPSITIGTQTWMDKNLNINRYRNGDPIPWVQDPYLWQNLTTGAWCYYNNDNEPTTAITYNKLYNWYAVNDPRGLAPEGWHIPSDEEWTILETSLGGSSVAGGKMKESGTAHWTSPNTEATDSSGFTALPGGYREFSASFGALGQNGYWWSATQLSSREHTLAWSRTLLYWSGTIKREYYSKKYGLSVRCIKD